MIDYAALLVQGQQLEAAKQLLQRRAEQHKVVGGDYVMKNVWQLLTNVGQLAASSHAGGESSKQLNQTREWLDFLRVWATVNRKMPYWDQWSASGC